MSVTVLNLIQGPATLYVAPFGSTEPLDTAVTAAPAAPWVDMGGTMGGLKISVSQDYASLDVDQLVDIPERRLTKREMVITTSLAEPTLQSLLASLNGGTLVTGAAVSTYDPVASLPVKPTYVALLVDGQGPNGLRRRIIMRKCINSATVDSNYSKTDQTVFSVTFSSHYVTASISPFHWVDQVA